MEHDPEGHQFVWKYLNLNYNSLYSFELSLRLFVAFIEQIGNGCIVIVTGKVQARFFRRKALTVAQPLEDSEELLRQAADGLQLRKMPAVDVDKATPLWLAIAFKMVML